MLFLFFSELRLYLNAVTETRLIVGTSRGETLRINFDVTFPSLACSLLSVDAMDISGEQHYDIRHDIIKKRIDHLGNVIESKSDGIGAPKVTFSEENVSLLPFLTNVCAIIGGIFTISGIVDAFLFHGQRAIKNKMASGKYG